MKGDFTRDTFDPGKHFSRVMMQQGRVQLDADWNEQSSILLHLLRALARDVYGPHWGPVDGAGFKMTVDNNKKRLLISSGRYYVDGILCENDDDVFYDDQSNWKIDPRSPGLEEGSYVVYLDVWERHITYLEDDDDVNIREVALGGPDTTTRAKVVWQVKAAKLADTAKESLDELKKQLAKARKAKDEDLISELTEKIKFLETEPRNSPDDVVAELLTISNATMRARAKISENNNKPCEIPPDARYRGVENQLYRVEIHSGSFDANGKFDPTRRPSFKWSRENGSVVLPIRDLKSSGNIVTVKLATLGRDDRFGLRINDLVEIVDDDYVLKNRAESLLKVTEINFDDRSVTLEGRTDIRVEKEPSNHPLLRRWDNAATKGEDVGDDKALLIGGGASDEDNGWITLEQGVQVQFQPDGKYRTGDYWLIPARTATGDVEWPRERNNDGKWVAKPMTPRGVIHHYAPLANISLNANKDISIPMTDGDLRHLRGLST